MVSARNHTIRLSAAERIELSSELLSLDRVVTPNEIQNRIIRQDLSVCTRFLPSSFVDLLLIDPPYNLNKTFRDRTFRRVTTSAYADWIESWLPGLLSTVKPTGSVYIFGDWRSSSALHLIAEKYLRVRNRITWEREKGRGAKQNWKNSSEDVWYCTISDTYTFNVQNVMLKRRVLAPYRDDGGEPKDWREEPDGRFRLTYPSNLWTDITVPFWSMPENTEHPTQKPEKLLAKLILASSNPGDVILDAFSGSGTGAVVAAKLGRSFVGIETDETYCCIAVKRLRSTVRNGSIQGYRDGVFLDRNATGAAIRREGPSLS